MKTTLAGLSESPFQNLCHPHLFYVSPGHDEALARMLYLVEQRRRCGIVVGPRGTGKTLLLTIIEGEVRRSSRQVALCDLSGKGPAEILWDLCAALGLAPHPKSQTRELWRQVQDHLLSTQMARLHTILLLDHLGQVEPDCRSTLERLLHITTSIGPGITVLTALRNEELAHVGWLRDHVDLRIDLQPLSREQTAEYVECRLKLSRNNHFVFEEPALRLVHDVSQGIPRDINRVCELATVAAAAFDADVIDESVILSVAAEVHHEPDVTWARSA